MKSTKIRIGIIGLLFGLIVLAMPNFFVSADEGMFMMDKLARLPLAEKGLKISTDQIYNAQGTGLSVAVPRLSIGCSSEFVSPDGLILTNHHCGFGALVAASTTEHNYGEMGYRAGSRAEELPAKGYAIDITLREEDVTGRVLNGIDASDDKALAGRIKEIETAEQTKMGGDVRVQIQALNSGIYYYLYAYQRISDIRIVYAPPQSIGFYGGDPDNFEWTRHCGDFTFMRAYVAPDGKAAEYSKDNVPFHPKKYLTISADGVKEDDYTMIIGYPGGTNRYRESYSIAYNQNVNLPFTVAVLKARIAALEEIGRGDEAKRVELQDEVFGLYNSLKAETGGITALRRANFVGQREADEAKLTAWINQNPERKAKYGDALPELKAAYEAYSKTSQKDVILRNIFQITPAQFVLAAVSGLAPKDQLKAFAPQVAAEEPIANRELFKFLLRQAAVLPADQKIPALEQRFGNLSGDARIRAEDDYARKVFEDSAITTEKGLDNIADMSAEQLKASTDPLIMMVREMSQDYIGSVVQQQALNIVLEKNRPLFIEAMAEMRGATLYPDANFTQRLTYGAVKGYMPKESISYAPFTTLDGVFEKDTGIAPFNAPVKLRQLWEKKDYGKYAVNGTIPVDFLTTNDIIGGNSGSPVLNGRGEQIGIAFDGNYEGLGDDFFFNPKLGRTICVDIRYVLFLTDKFGDASWIFKEMNIVGGNFKTMAAVN